MTESEEFATNVYRKPTNTNVIMHHRAVVPNKWKTSLINCFLNRAVKLSSSQELLEKEVNNIKELFKLNGYPEEFIDNNVNRFLMGLDSANNNNSDDSATTTKESDTSDGVQSAYLVLPYVGRCSTRLHKRITYEMKHYGVRIMPAYRTAKVGSYFSLKTKIPPLFKSNVVYKFVCPCDEGTQYVGETERQLFKRLQEHTSRSNTAQSAIYDHMLQCEGCATVNNISKSFAIIRQCQTIDILSQEALFIKRLQPSLNVQLGHQKDTELA